MHISKRVIFCLTVGLFPSFSAFSTHRFNDLQFYTEEYPPYNFTQEDKVVGVSVELLLKAGEILQSPIEKQNLKVRPWPRAYRTVLEMKNSVLFSTVKTNQRENLFHWAGPIAKTRVVLIGRKSSHINIENDDDIKKYAIGVIIDDIGEQLVLNRGVGEKNITNASTGMALSQMLEYGRIDLWAYEEKVALLSIKNAGLNIDDYEAVYTLQESEMYFAFNKSTDYQYVEALQMALDELKKKDIKTGVSEYDKIVAKYRDWDKSWAQ